MGLTESQWNQQKPRFHVSRDFIATLCRVKLENAAIRRSDEHFPDGRGSIWRDWQEIAERICRRGRFPKYRYFAGTNKVQCVWFPCMLSNDQMMYSSLSFDCYIAQNGQLETNPYIEIVIHADNT